MLGLAAAASVGMIASRAFEAWTSSLGMLAGAAVFAVVTGQAAVRIVRDMDYYYSAY